MLNITIKGEEYFDDATQRFVTTPAVDLELEHSLAALSKWESIWEKPFLGPNDKSNAEATSYIICMTITPHVPREVYDRLTDDHITAVNNYIGAKMSATWFADEVKKGGPAEIITAEIIYYWMISLDIPLEWETRHLNRLFTLIKVCNEKNSPKKKLSQRELAERNRSLNAQRRAKLGTTG